MLKANHLELLNILFDKVYIPQAVYNELVSNSKFKDEAKIIDHCPYIYIEEVLDQKSVNILRRATGLDSGESEAIIMADEKNADLLLMDERKGRIVAKQMGLEITGTIGIILQSYDESILTADEVKESLIKLKECGIRMSDSLYSLVLNHVDL